MCICASARPFPTGRPRPASSCVILCCLLCPSVRVTSCACISVIHAGAFVAPVDRGIAGHLVSIQVTPW